MYNSFREQSRWERTRDYMSDRKAEIFIVTAILTIVIGMLYGTVAAHRQHEKERKAFMFECTKDHKEYECTAMWRAGEPKTVVVPINTTTVR